MLVENELVINETRDWISIGKFCVTVESLMNTLQNEQGTHEGKSYTVLKKPQ